MTIGIPATARVLEAYAGVLDTLTPADPVLVSPWSWSWEGPQGLRPAQPGPVQLKAVILAPGPLDDLDIGVPCQAVLTHDHDPATPVAELYGRITDLEARPVEYAFPDGTHVDGLEYSLTAVDYTPDAAEVGLTDPTFVAESADDRIDAAATGTLRPRPVLYGGLGGTLESYYAPPLRNPTTAELDVTVTLAAQPDATVEPPTLRDAITRVLGQVAPNASGAASALLAPHVTASGSLPALKLDGDDPWVIDYLPRGAGAVWADASWYPAEVVEYASGLWGLLVDPDASGWVLSADHIDYDAKWTRHKVGDPTRLAISAPLGGGDPTVVLVDSSDFDPDLGVVTEALDAPDLTTVAAVASMAAMYLPVTDRADRWEAEGFRFYASEDPARLYPAWFPRHALTPGTSYGERARCYVQPVVVHGITEAETPTGKAFHYGTLDAVELVADGDEVVIDFRVRRTVPPSSTAAAFTAGDWATLAGGGPTVAELDPRFSVYDYRLARRA